MLGFANLPICREFKKSRVENFIVDMIFDTK